jgi:hypothetical protein
MHLKPLHAFEKQNTGGRVGHEKKAFYHEGKVQVSDSNHFPRAT